MHLSCTVLKIQRVICQNSPTVFGTSIGGDRVRITKTRVPGLSCGVVCVILSVAILIQYRLVTDGHTDTHMTANTALA